MLSDTLQARRPLARWQSGLSAWRGGAGTAQSRALRETKVYVDPPNVAPGIYAIVKFEESFQHLPLVCGFFVWTFANETDPRIVRDVQVHLGPEAFAKTKPQQRNVFRRSRGCAPI